jgi:hypothetical protein
VAELPLLAALRAPDPIREDILRTFGDEEEGAVEFAIKWAWDHRRVQGLSQAVAARYLGIAPSHMCNILAAKKYLPPHKINLFEQLVGNRAVSMTIERFRQIHERQLVAGLSRVIAENMVRAA